MTPAGVISISTGRGAGPAIGLLGDRRLARLAAKGDARAFAAIYERHHQGIFRYCRSVTGNAEDASDALQSTMAAALRALPGERREVSLRAWLFRIAHNESLSIIRRRANYAEMSEAAEPFAPGPDAVLAVRERLSGLLADLSSLPERQRGALVMRELIGLDYPEIADALSLSPGAARQAVYEARVALAQSDQGREMACDAARRSISAGDGRALRSRRLRAHMRGCSGCSDFKEQLGARRSALPGLLPPLPAAAGAAILGGLVGGAASVGAGASVGALGSAGSGGVMSLMAGGVSQAAGASAVAKGAAAAVAVAIVAGVGTVEVRKAVDAPAPPARASIQEHGGAPAAPSQSALAAARPGLAARRRARAAVPASPGAAPGPQPAGTPPAGGGRARSKRSPLSPERAVDPDVRPPDDPVPAPRPPLPVPVSTVAPAAPASPPASAPVQPWQQQYTDSMRQAQLGIQIGAQVYQQAMQLTQKMMNGIFPLSPRR